MCGFQGNAFSDFYVHSPDVAKGFGLTTVAQSGNEVVRWARVNEYLSSFGFRPNVGEDDFLLRDTREKRLAIAAAKERMERTGQDIQTIKSIRMDTKVQTNHQFDLAEFVERLEEAKLAYLKSYEAWITRASVVYRILDAAGCHAELWATISRRYLWARPWNEVAKAVGVSRRMANTYERRAIEQIAASEAAGEIITRAGRSCDLPILRTASRRSG